MSLMADRRTESESALSMSCRRAASAGSTMQAMRSRAEVTAWGDFPPWNEQTVPPTMAARLQRNCERFERPWHWRESSMRYPPSMRSIRAAETSRRWLLVVDVRHWSQVADQHLNRLA